MFVVQNVSPCIVFHSGNQIFYDSVVFSNKKVTFFIYLGALIIFSNFYAYIFFIFVLSSW